VKKQSLWCIDVLEIVLRAEPMKLVGVGISSRARVEWYFDFLENLFRAFDRSVDLQGCVIMRYMMNVRCPSG